jgi:membrane-associated protease RseP (regulator of RpoE activity)
VLVGLLFNALVFIPTLLLLLRAEGVRNAFAPAATPGKGLTRAVVPSLVSYSALVALFLFVALTARRSWPARVAVEPGFPAAQAGLRDGDQLLSVGGAPLDSYQDLLDAPQRKVTSDYRVVRDGAQLTVTITPDAQGKIGVRAYGEPSPLPLSRALPVSLVAPMHALLDVARYVVRDTAERLTTRKESAPAGLLLQPGSALALVEAVAYSGSLVWPLSLLFSVVLWLSSRRRAAASTHPTR